MRGREVPGQCFTATVGQAQPNVRTGRYAPGRQPHRLAAMATTADEAGDDFEQLHGLITGTQDVKGFLDGMTGFAAGTMSRVTGTGIECAVTLRRSKSRVTVAGSSAEAMILDAIEQSLDDGPCMEAMRIGVPVLLADVATDTRWPEFSKSLAAAGCRSVLGVPLDLEGGAAALLNFFAPTTGLFTPGTIQAAEIFADMASRTLDLALRLSASDQRADNLQAAMESRTSIDLACGIIMPRTAAPRTWHAKCFAARPATETGN